MNQLRSGSGQGRCRTSRKTRSCRTAAEIDAASSRRIPSDALTTDAGTSGGYPGARRGNRQEDPMRAMLIIWSVLIASGIVLYTIIDLTHG
jgi:hypothetical protein